ncbi:MAG: YgiW/YdeI family stress tolerance OB fold protein [Desulfovibrionaceae bacterium]|nr:YgiW/YdeI family stress tolerance OB fold protein [Desulfovibrionaceae bacterium]
MRILLIPALVLLLAGSVWAAGFQEQAQGGSTVGGFQGPSMPAGVTSVAKAKLAADDTPVILTGNIVSRTAEDHEHYIFKDQTGEITIDLDDDLFMGRTVTPQTKIRIYGEVDKEMFDIVKIDVKRFDILK